MKCLLSFLALVLTFALHGEMPFYMLRLRAVETDDVATWEETRQAISDNPGCCDEVWFSTGIGYPTLAAHRERAAKQAKAAADWRPKSRRPEPDLRDIALCVRYRGFASIGVSIATIFVEPKREGA